MEKKEQLLAPFRQTIDDLVDSIVGKNPHHAISGPPWAIKHKIVLNYIEAYVIENKELPTGIHFIMKFKGRPNAYPGPIGERGFVDFDEYLQLSRMNP
tara:strand:+ start:604 stop:897 length:294 start_codon:yes stop_codon:yes gene_type:complete